MLTAIRFVMLGLVIALAGCSETDHDIPSSTLDGSAEQTTDAFTLSDANFDAFLAGINRAHLQGEPRERLRGEWRRKTQFAQKARQAGLVNDSTYQAKLAQFQRETLAQMYVDRELEKRLTDSALKALYEERKHDLASEEVHLVARFFPVTNPQDLQASSAAKAEAEALMLEVSGGADFLPDEVTQTTQGKVQPGIDRSGDLGWLPVNYAQSRFGAILSSAAEGAILGPVNVNSGWYVLRVVEGPRKKIPELAQVRRQLMEQERQRIVTELAQELSSDERTSR